MHAPVHGLRRSLDTFGIPPPQTVGEAEAELTVLVDPSRQHSHLGPSYMLEFGRGLDNESHEYFAYQSRVLPDIHERFGAVRGSIPTAYEANPWVPRITMR